MNSNLDKFLSSLENYHKKSIIMNCKKNSNFDKFISYCVKLNISLFNNDKNNTPKKHKYLINKFYDYKEVLVRSFGIKVIKDYSSNSDNIIRYIQENMKKLENKINYINFLINTLENIIDSDSLYSLLSNKCENRKINYTESLINTDSIEKKTEILDLTNDLFVKSDDYSSSDEKTIESVNLVYSNTPFIAEYSN